MRIPKTISEAIATLDPALQAMPGELDKAKSLLDAVQFDYTPNPLKDKAVAAISARETINSVLLKGGRIVTVHPWTMGAGDFGKGYYSEQNIGYLSPEKAANHLANKLLDPEDPDNAGATVIFGVVVYADTLKAWIDSLYAINKIFPFGDLPVCERRARCLLTLDTTKMILKKPFLNPHWKDYELMFNSTIAEVKKDSDDLLGTVESLALDDNPITELQAVIDAKKAEVAESIKAWSDLSERIKDGKANAYYLTGANPSTLAAQVRSIDTSSTAKYCAIFAVIANTEADLKFFKEAFI